MTIMDIRSICARVRVESHFCGMAFLISSRYALTVDRVVTDHSWNDTPLDNIELEFPLGKYGAKVEVLDKHLQCAVLMLDREIEDVIPIGLGVDVTLGDTGRFYGFLHTGNSLLEGAGVFLEGQVQDIALSNKEYPAILLFPSRSISPRLLRGFSGTPLVVGNLIVGILLGSYGQDRGDTDFILFTRIQDILELLPKEISQRILPSPMVETEVTKTGKPEILVITALDEELDYLFELPLGWSELKVQKDGISYRRGHFADDIDIIATSARSTGLIAASILTAKALKEWNPSVVAMIGICGGRKEKGVNIGDIVVANQCFHYQYGSFENGKIVRELRVENTETQIIDIVEHLARRTNVLTDIYQSLPRGFKKPNTLLQCHVGPMASADLVVKDIEKFGEAIDADRKTIAVEMESYAFMRAARLAKTRWAFVVKSVTDFADAKKDDEYREYAKYTSAKFFIQVAQSLIIGWG